MTAASVFDLKRFLQTSQQRCQQNLGQQLDQLPELPSRLREAMRYASLNGGKRIRPALVYASGEACDGPADALDAAAMAVELVHCYSLVHDDLPAMDDDELRRGRPTVHKAFDEATAILAGDALQALAFQVLSQSSMPGSDVHTRLQMVSLLSQASGYQGMAGGQSVDIAFAEQAISGAELESMHALKTGALIRASVQLGALCGTQTSDQAFAALTHYADCIGLAFQVQDDILDVTGDTGTLGKTRGADEARNKPTYVSLLGLEQASRKAQQLTEEAISAIQHFDQRANALRNIAEYIVQRRH